MKQGNNEVVTKSINSFETMANPIRVLDCISVVAFPPIIIPTLIRIGVGVLIRKKVVELSKKH